MSIFQWGTLGLSEGILLVIPICWYISEFEINIQNHAFVGCKALQKHAHGPLKVCTSCYCEQYILYRYVGLEKLVHLPCAHTLKDQSRPFRQTISECWSVTDFRLISWRWPMTLTNDVAELSGVVCSFKSVYHPHFKSVYHTLKVCTGGKKMHTGCRVHP